jgi:ATP synthase alpha/beta chain, C terminal domain
MNEPPGSRLSALEGWTLTLLVAGLCLGCATDGLLYLSPALFELGILPAADVAKSVSQVGSAAQLAAYRTLAGTLKLTYSQFEELEAFSRFGTRLDEHSRRIIEHGQRIRACLGQAQFTAVTVLAQITILQASLRASSMTSHSIRWPMCSARCARPVLKSHPTCASAVFEIPS